MTPRWLLIAALALLPLAAPATAAVPFTIDASHSSIGFGVTHMLVSTVTGKFTDFSGTVHFDEADLTRSAVEVVIRTASIDTGNSRRDDHLRNSDFFDAEQFPDITFRSQRVERDGEGYALVGPLTMRGVTREVRIPFRLRGTITDPSGNTRLGAAGRLTLNRQDYGVSWSRALDTGGLVVGNEVEIELSIQAIHQKKE